MTDTFLTVSESKKALGVGNTFLYKLLNNKQLEAVKIGRSTRILKSSIDSFISSLPTYPATNRGAK